MGYITRIAYGKRWVKLHEMQIGKNTMGYVTWNAKWCVLIVLYIKEDDLSDAEYVDAIHSILVTGIYPHLFTNDEMDGLLLVGTWLILNLEEKSKT